MKKVIFIVMAGSLVSGCFFGNPLYKKMKADTGEHKKILVSNCVKGWDVKKNGEQTLEQKTRHCGSSADSSIDYYGNVLNFTKFDDAFDECSEKHGENEEKIRNCYMPKQDAVYQGLHSVKLR